MLPDALQQFTRLSRLVDLAYDGSANPGAWPVFLSALCEVLDADSAQFQSLNAHGATGFWLAHGMDRDAFARYERHFAHLDPWRAGMRVLPAGTSEVLRGEQLVDDETFLQSSFYRDYLRPMNIRWARLLQLAPAEHGAPQYTLCAFRAPSRGGFDGSADGVLRALGPHLLRVESLATFNALLACGRTTNGQDAVLFLTANGRLVRANRAGEALARTGDLDHGLTGPKFATPAVNLWLYGLLNQPQRVEDENARVLLHRLPSLGEVRFEILRLPGPGPSPALFPAHYAMIVSRLPAPEHHMASPKINTFGWTRTEHDIVRRLTMGHTPAQIAVDRGSSVETIRSHLKRAMRKAGVARQVDLVRLVYQSEGRG